MTSPTMRWLIRRDLPEVLAIEREAFEQPWTQREFLRELRQQKVIGRVLEVGDHIAGYMVYENSKRHVTLLNMAVRHDLRRQWLGTGMLEALRDNCVARRRQSVGAWVDETNLRMHLLLRSCGFLAVDRAVEYWPSRDALLFRWAPEFDRDPLARVLRGDCRTYSDEAVSSPGPIPTLITPLVTPRKDP